MSLRSVSELGEWGEGYQRGPKQRRGLADAAGFDGLPALFGNGITLTLFL